MVVKAVLALLIACLAAGTARAAEFGANDDTGKYLADTSGQFFSRNGRSIGSKVGKA